MTKEEQEAKARALKLVLALLLYDDDTPPAEVAAVQAVIAAVQGQPVCARNLAQTLETLEALAQEFNDTVEFAEAVRCRTDLIVAQEAADTAAASSMPQMAIPQFLPAWQCGDLTRIL